MIYLLETTLFVEVRVEANSEEEALEIVEKKNICWDHHIVDQSEVDVSMSVDQTTKPDYQ